MAGVAVPVGAVGSVFNLDFLVKGDLEASPLAQPFTQRIQNNIFGVVFCINFQGVRE